jgi:CRISPR-associated endonuclease/helicase Cas3
MTFDQFFCDATEYQPFSFQKSLALADDLPDIIHVPTGLGKTGIILVWLWRRFFHPDQTVRDQTPRRLVYTLPMRTLVNQTVDNAEGWIANLVTKKVLTDPCPVTVLMGGEQNALSGRSWDAIPEKEQILVGTQDQMLSRALNRGYAMSRFRWPAHFALLNNDALWIMDETQLMGTGLTTSLQLDGFRRFWKTAKPCKTIWMSATIGRQALTTVDHPEEFSSNRMSIDISDIDENSVAGKRVFASKPLKKSEILFDKSNKQNYEKSLAVHISDTLLPGPSETVLVILNQVKRAVKTYQQLKTAVKKMDTPPECLLLHSRFRPADRRKTELKLKQSTPENGRIIVSTQVIEAGVDLDANRLVTELAPWSSMIQRFGRCNRMGLRGSEQTSVEWIDIDDEMTNDILPYNAEELYEARKRLELTDNAGIDRLQTIDMPESSHIPMVIRKRELRELFDTTPDLSGWDIDVGRYIRENDALDVHVFWRQWAGSDGVTGKNPPPDNLPSSCPEEMCAVSVSEFRKFFKKLNAGSKEPHPSAWIWNALDRCWTPLQSETIRPGLAVMMNSLAGGYDQETGWNSSSKVKVIPMSAPETSVPEAMEDDVPSEASEWQSISMHTSHVKTVMKYLISKGLAESDMLTEKWKNELIDAVHWHDVGKAHPAFQNRLVLKSEPPADDDLWAKSPHYGRSGLYPMEPGKPETSRKYFRHELVSALAALENNCSDLIVYLVAAHHGKVRMAIRPVSGEIIPSGSRRFALGVWDGDTIPGVRPAPDIETRPFSVNLDVMEFGDSDNGPGWTHRMQVLLDEMGPFRLSWFEYLLRVADWRGSRMKGNRHD